MKKITLFLLISILYLSFAACSFVQSDNSSSSEGGEVKDSSNIGLSTYTVTWINFDGSILEIDEEVKEGENPVYNGEEPKKANEGDYSFIFDGWTPLLSKVVCDATYTAVFKSIYNGADVLGPTPVFEADGTVSYGLYPQTCVADENLIASLNLLSPSEINGWYLFEGNYYAKKSATVYGGEQYFFDDGRTIENGAQYWFKCEPIKWQILSNENGEYYLLSTLLLDAKSYYSNYETRNIDGQTIYSSDYANSDLRKWLNGEFYKVAFVFNNSFIKQTTVENGGATTEFSANEYSCENTFDNVFLPSFQDYLNPSFGFSDKSGLSSLREAKTTDYARAVGAWCHTRNNGDELTQTNGSYWTRSPSSEYDYCVSVVNSGGVLSAYVVDDASHSVRPAIRIKID